MNPAAWTPERPGQVPPDPGLRLSWTDLRDARGPEGLFAALWVQALHPGLGLDTVADPARRTIGRAVLEGWARDAQRDVMSRCLSTWVLVQSAQGRRERATATQLLEALSRRATSPESFRRCRALATGLRLPGTRRSVPSALALDLVDPSPAVRASALLSAWIVESQTLEPSLLRALVDDDARVRELAATLLAASRRGLRPLPGRSLLDPRALTHGPHAGWIWARVPVQAPATALEAVHDGRRTSVVLPVPSLPPMDIAWLPVGDAAAVPSPLEIYQASQSWIDLE